MKYVQDLYDLPHFYNYDNFYTIQENRSNLVKKVFDENEIELDRYADYQTSSIFKSKIGKPHYIIVGTKIKYVPIYGHFFDNYDQFVYKHVYKSKQENFKRNKFFKCRQSDLCKSPLGNWYRFDYIEDLYDQIEFLQQKEYESRKERINQEPYIGYNEDKNYELVTEYINPINTTIKKYIKNKLWH